MEVNQKKISNLRNLIRHRFYYFLFPFLALFLLSLGATFLLPVEYESSVTMLSERGNISPELIQSWSTNLIDQRMDELQQVIMSRSTLKQVIERNNLYEDFRADHSMEQAIEEMKTDITYTTNMTDIVNSGLGRPMKSILTFIITFTYKDPEVAARVTGELAQLYIDRNTMAFEQQVDDTTSFLHSEHSRLESAISALESEIAEFKEQHVNEMPELMTTTLQTLAQLETDIDTLTTGIQNLRERKLEVQGNLRKTDPYGSIVQATGEKVMSPEESLDALRFEYISKRSSMSEKHPDIVSLKRQIAELETVVSRRATLAELRTRLRLLETRRSEMAGRMTADHPDLVKLNGEIGAVREALNGLTDQIASDQEEVAREPDNPAYIELETQLAIVELDIQECLTKLEKAKNKHDAYSRRVRLMPGVEEQYLSLTRNYENMKNEYQDISTKLAEANKARSLVSDRKGEMFSILEPATVPEKPVSPNIPVFLTLSLVLSVLVGMGAVYAAELTDSTLNTAEELRLSTDLPVFTAIPFMENREDRLRRFFRRILIIIAVVAALFLMVIVTGYYLVNFT